MRAYTLHIKILVPYNTQKKKKKTKELLNYVYIKR